MSGEAHRTVREALGAFVLGHLDPSEAAGVRAHLDGCAACRDELAEIRSVLGLLGGVDPRALDDTPVPPPGLGDRIVERARRERPRAARRVPWAAAAAVVLVGLAAGVGGVVVGRAGTGGDDAGPREALAVQAVDPAVAATASAVPHTWGVEIVLDAAGFAPGAVYRVSVRDDGGRAVSAGEFVGTGSAAMHCNLNSSVLRADAAGFDVVDARGAVVVRGEL